MTGLLAWLICFAVAVPAAMLALECLVGSSPETGSREGRAPPPFAVLMPAHQEEGGIGESVAAVVEELRACDVLLVIADNCTDDTAVIAGSLGANVVERDDPARRGKGYALELGREIIASDPVFSQIEAVLLVDADCRPAPGALGRLASRAAMEGKPVQGAYLLECPQDAAPVVRISCLAFLIKNLVRQRALHRLAGSALLQGSGMAFPRQMFLHARWDTTSLVEDAEQGLMLLLDGKPTDFEPGAQFFSSASSIGGTASQRRRWEHGMLQTASRFVPRLLILGATGRPRLLVVAVDLLVPPTVLLVMLLLVATAGIWLLAGSSLPLLVVLAVDLMLALAIGVAWHSNGRAIVPPGSLVQIPGYFLWKLPILAQFVTRRERQWVRTERIMNYQSTSADMRLFGAASAKDVGFVIIGRNEGSRLEVCIRSVLPQATRVVYVDSGSTDESVHLAARYGVPVRPLDPSRPFTAARARNAGAAWLLEKYPALQYLHFIDGDCELLSGWLQEALGVIHAEPRLAAVCGRRRERRPDASVYNRLCDHEWNTPVGLSQTCGGDALFRVEPFRSVDGFSEDLIAGEEPDLCHRIRQRGWQIRRLDVDMTLHDAAMSRFVQWWQRNRRSGFATAEACYRRGQHDPRLRRQVASNVFWAIPLAWPLWPLLWTRICLRWGPLQASFMTLGKLPHFQGQTDFWRRRKSLIEYK